MPRKKSDVDSKCRFYAFKVSNNQLTIIKQLDENLVAYKDKRPVLNMKYLKQYLLNTAQELNPKVEPVVSTSSSKFSPDEDTLLLLNEEHQVEGEADNKDVADLITDDDFKYHFMRIVEKNGNPVLLKFKTKLRRSSLDDIKNGLPEIEDVLMTHDDEYFGNRQERLESLEVVKQFFNQQQ